MSVINQMLKDLDQRQGDESINNERQHIFATQRQPKKTWLLILLSLVLINVFTLIIWWQYQENQQLKAQQNITSTANIASEQLEHQVKSPAASIKESSLQRSIDTERQNTVVKQSVNRVDENISSQVTEQQNENQQIALSIQKNVPSNNSNEQVHRQQPTTTNNTVKQQENDTAQQHVSSKTDSKPTLSIARKQLTPKELVDQKTNAAQQAIERSEIKQAEQLLEEILLIQPTHHSSRKQLAALWFGRQDYRAALNVLFQGISLAPQNPDFRIMQARIYIKQGMLSNAIASLLPLAKVDNVEFQSLLASLTQQVGDHKKSAAAYLRLTQLQPAQGKWWLGYAVALDSQGEFNLAKSAYRQTQQTNDISESTRQFIRQRLTEIGE